MWKDMELPTEAWPPTNGHHLKAKFFFSVGGSQLAIVPEPGVGHIESLPTPCWKFY